MLKINIICSDNGWIYSKFISMFYRFSKHQIFVNSKEQCDVVHYLPYQEKLDNDRHPCTVYLSHQDQDEDRFIYAVQTADFSISMSRKYMCAAVSYGVGNIIQIVPGVDFQKFRLRTEKRLNKNKLIVGYIGKQFNAEERKNPKLLQKIVSLPFVDLKISGGLIKEHDLPQFYSSLDIIISPALNESGPMALIEGLAVGTPFLCFDGVGMANEFDEGVIKVPFADEEAFIKRLEEFWDNSEELKFRKYELMSKLREQVTCFTWEDFVVKHDKVWEELKGV